MSVSAEERRIVTVLFADVAGSTSLGEQLDPEEMRSLLARYYSIARACVEEHGGTVEKFIGDAIMAVFGLPTAHGDDPDRAIAAATMMRDKVQADARLEGRLAIRFGVSTGEVVASRDQSAGDFLVTGDATNVAARLQQAAEPWAILASDRTARAAIDFEFAEKAEILAKGKAMPVAARVVLGRRTSKSDRTARLPLVGRENDLAQLQLIARRVVKDRRPSMVSVIAPAGTGKTRLVEEFLDWLPSLSREAIVATAQCLPYGQQLTYWPMRQVLFTLTGSSEGAPAAEILDRISAWLRRIGVEDADRDARLLAATIGEAGTESVDKELLFAAWRAALEASARQQPLVVVFEDLHWSSDSLLDLAEFVMQPRGDAAVLMIVLARPELLDRRPNWGGGRLNHLALALEPLDGGAIADLVRHLLETDEPDVVDLVATRSEGNPFYAGELVRSYLAHGALERLPDTVQATVLARLDLLPSDERRFIQLGSIFGRAFTAGGVAALDGGDKTNVQRLAENLVERDLIRPAEGDRYSFRHILIQEIAYGTLPRAERARLHAQAARWLESGAEGREVALAEILAFHYREAAGLMTALAPADSETAETREAAGRWLLKAADIAAAAAATPEAVRHIRAAFDFVDPKLKPHLHERIGDITAGDAGLEDYRQALSLYDAMDAPVEDKLRAVAGILMVAMRWVGSVGDRPSEDYINQLRDRGHELLKVTTDRYAIARFVAADAFFPFWVQGNREPTAGEIERGKTSAEQARKMAAEQGNADLESAALDALAGVAQAGFDWTWMRAIADERIAFASRVDFYERLDAHSMAAWASYNLGDLAAADSASADMAARLLPGQAPYPALHLFAWRALTLNMLGRWDEAIAVFWRAIEAWHDAGSHAAGYALRGFSVGLDVGRARGDARLVSGAAEAMESILGRFQAVHLNRTWFPYIRGEPSLEDLEALLVSHLQAEIVERRLGLSNDMHRKLSEDFISPVLERAHRQRLPLLEAQAMRARALSRNDVGAMRAAISIWEFSGALPQLARARAELGLLSDDSSETDAGLAMLKEIGDVNYLDRFAAASV